MFFYLKSLVEVRVSLLVMGGMKELRKMLGRVLVSLERCIYVFEDL